MNVKIIGFEQKNLIFKYYKSADLFVLPTREDIWGLVVNEAMACGIPVITTNRCIAGIELIEDGINGYIVEVGNSLDLKEKIFELLQNDNLCKKMASNNVKKMHGNTIENIAKSHIDVIQKFLAK
jgi:glycosyltransferase involved in cell wall biosynthesis